MRIDTGCELLNVYEEIPKNLNEFSEKLFEAHMNLNS